jgi:hypothetical protein
MNHGKDATSEAQALQAVEGMLAEHRVIVDLVEELRTASGVPAAVAGDTVRADLCPAPG